MPNVNDVPTSILLTL